MPAPMSSVCRRGVPALVVAVQAGDQVGHRDVEEAAGGEREHVGQRGRQVAGGGVDDDGPDDAGRAGGDVQQSARRGL